MESEGSDSHAPSEPSFRILDYPGAALRYTNRVGTEWERRKAREGPDRRYGPFADADEYGVEGQNVPRTTLIELDRS